jgi:predicted  nucleic acid-binding Zn-ribbon protein
MDNYSDLYKSCFNGEQQEDCNMKKMSFIIVGILVIVTMILGACAGSFQNEPNNSASNSTGGGGNGSGGGGGNEGGSGDDGGDNSGSDEVGLKIIGKVDEEISWPEEEIRAMETIEAVSENSSREESTYTGVPIITLLGLADVEDDASKVVFVADDGYSAEVTLEELNACTDCIVSFRNKGGFSIVMPGFSGKLQVKGVIEIQVE